MRIHKLIVALSLFLALAAPATASAETIAVIGTGDVAGALGPAFAKQGHTIVYGSRDPSTETAVALAARTGDKASVTTPAEAAAGADVVVLAVPGLMVEEITLGLGDLSGKIIIDPTNPLTKTDYGMFEHGADTSNAEIIQAAAPDAKVVKAFNTLNWKTMVKPASSGVPVSVPLVGNDGEAKVFVAGLVNAMGLEAIDVGPLSHARWVEGMLILWLNNEYVYGPTFDFHLRLTKVK